MTTQDQAAPAAVGIETAAKAWPSTVAPTAVGTSAAKKSEVPNSEFGTSLGDGRQSALTASQGATAAPTASRSAPT